ncbi:MULTISPECIES: DEAD/DEAH box helicase [Methylotenera]|uniref:DEAD/DEAH box helicase n=1 Tax=Methylotenera TaxID=359407 RepID=UPI0003627DE1|nr:MULTISPECIES: DEAD/DEAH box helicase [Methylotenera]
MFDALGLAAPLLKAVSETGYTTPTPIQAKAIPLALQGLDLMAGAQTGTGKTAAFALPILQKLLPFASPSTSPAKHPIRALVLTPTRELAIQVEESIKVYAKYTPLKSLVVFGGVDIKTQTPHLKTGIEILVATPGRLLDHVEQKTLNLSQVQILVLDEADRMLDMGFMPDLKRILALLPKQRQNLMFSATFSNEIKKLADDFLTNPTLIEVARSNATNDNVTQKVYLVAQNDKQALLTHLLSESNSQQVIIFTKTKITASKLSRALQKEGITADAIHGDKSQKERIEALDAFKAGKITALVATDVAARGLDISDLPMVINYEIPSAPEDYVHRIGRTGRAGASGVAISLVSEDEEKYLAEIEKLIKRSIEKVQADATVLAKATRQSSATSSKKTSSLPQQDNDKLDSNRHAAKPRQHTRKPSKDPWFDKPYEPTIQQTTNSNTRFPANSRKTPIAALLGGLKLTNRTIQK